MDDVEAPDGLLSVWEHPGLEPLDQAELVLQLVLLPARFRNVSWSVFDTGGDRLRVRRVQVPGWSAYKEGGGSPQLFGSDGWVPRTDLQPSLDQFAQLPQPLLPEPFWGIGGFNYLISHAPTNHETVGRAWSRYPANAQVEALAAWFHHTAEQVLDACLPQYSSKVPDWKTPAKPPSPTWRG